MKLSETGGCVEVLGTYAGFLWAPHRLPVCGLVQVQSPDLFVQVQSPDLFMQVRVISGLYDQ